MKIYYVRHKSGYYERISEPLFGGKSFEYKGEDIGHVESDSDKSRIHAFAYMSNKYLEIKKEYLFELDYGSNNRNG